MKMTRTSKGVIVTGSGKKGTSGTSVTVPGKGIVYVVERSTFRSAKDAAGSRLSKAIASSGGWKVAE